MAVRITFKKGRTTAKGQAYRVGHNDRLIDFIRNASHIDTSRSHLNQYYTFDDATKTFVKATDSLENHEKAVYNNLFGDMLQDMNDRAVKARHKERVKTMDDIYTDIYKCPEETIVQIDKDGFFQDIDGFNRVIQSFLKEQEKLYPNIKLLDYAIHADETSLHAHIRQVYIYDDKGITKAGQHKCLEHYGFKLPEPDKKRSQFNNLKIPFTDITRELCYKAVERELGLEVEREPISPSQRQKTKLEANLEQIEALADANREYAESHEKIILEYEASKRQEEKSLVKAQKALVREQIKHQKLENKELQKKIEATDYNKEQIQTLNEFELELNQKKESLERREREINRINRELSEYKSSYRELCKEREELLQYTSELKSELHELAKENENLQHKSKKLDKALEFMQTLGNGEETVLQMFKKELERQRRHRDKGFDR